MAPDVVSQGLREPSCQEDARNRLLSRLAGFRALHTPFLVLKPDFQPPAAQSTDMYASVIMVSS